MRTHIKLRIVYNLRILLWYLTTKHTCVWGLILLALEVTSRSMLQRAMDPMYVYVATLIWVAIGCILLGWLLLCRNVEYTSAVYVLEVYDSRHFILMYKGDAYTHMMYRLSRLKVHHIIRDVLAQRHPNALWLEYETEDRVWERVKYSLNPSVF